jgi:hypothetical protein
MGLENGFGELHQIDLAVVIHAQRARYRLSIVFWVWGIPRAIRLRFGAPGALVAGMRMEGGADRLGQLFSGYGFTGLQAGQ